VLVVRGKLTPEPDEIPLAATDAHVRVDGRDLETVLSCVWRDRIPS